MRSVDGPGSGRHRPEPLDLLLAVFVVLVFVGAAARDVPVIVARVKLSGVMQSMSAGQYDQVLARVEDGDFETTPARGEMPEIRGASDGHFGDAWQAEGVPGGLRITGSIARPARRGIVLQSVLAVPDTPDAPAVLLPVCGHHPVPAGWRLLGAPPPANPNDDLLPWICAQPRRGAMPARVAVPVADPVPASSAPKETPA